MFNDLTTKGFIELKRERDEVWAEETYLQSVIEDDLAVLDNLKEMKNIFSNDADALFSLENRASHIGVIDIHRAEYMRIAVQAYEEALKVYTLDRFPMDYAMTQNNLGAAYSTLAAVEAKAANCKKAIEAYEEALKVFTEGDFPEIYPLIKGNLINTLVFCGSE